VDRIDFFINDQIASFIQTCNPAISGRSVAFRPSIAAGVAKILMRSFSAFRCRRGFSSHFREEKSRFNWYFLLLKIFNKRRKDIGIFLGEMLMIVKSPIFM
jgi:hypothetical protein